VKVVGLKREKTFEAGEDVDYDWQLQVKMRSGSRRLEEMGEQ
jgi:hypothetical protein